VWYGCSVRVTDPPPTPSTHTHACINTHTHTHTLYGTRQKWMKGGLEVNDNLIQKTATSSSSIIYIYNIHTPVYIYINSN